MAGGSNWGGTASAHVRSKARAVSVCALFLDLGERLRETGLLEARLCRRRAKQRSPGSRSGSRSHAVGRPADRGATLLQAGRGCAVGLYAPLPVSLDGQRRRTRPLDPRGVRVVLEV